MKKVKTRQQIAEEYGISYRTLLRWLKRASLEIPSGLISIRYQERVYEEFGDPRNKRERL